MVHTVAITGANGNVGGAIAKHLVKAAADGKFNLVVYHREGKQPKALAGDNVEFRVFDLSDSPEKMASAIKGVNVFISAVGFGAVPSEPNVVQALSKSKDFVTYIPSFYSTTWDDNDEKHPQIGPIVKYMHSGWDKAKEMGVAVTPVYVGNYENYWFGIGFGGSPLKENLVWANKKQLANKIPITLLDHVGTAVARIVSRDPESIKNKQFSAVTFWPTGDELAELYGKLHGKKCNVKDFTEADRDKLMADGENFGPMKVGYFDRWQNNSWRYDQDGRIGEHQYSGDSLEETARRFM
ncbi:hypothetical protein ANO11243_056510 [Dothideomycetidae sp. 11243]|nr:hypothetical protein ANO11243_056510 [fungal sp. No.11243]